MELLSARKQSLGNFCYVDFANGPSQVKPTFRRTDIWAVANPALSRVEVLRTGWIGRSWLAQTWRKSGLEDWLARPELAHT